MTHTTLKLVTAAVIVATTALISGCSNKAQDIDLTLIGGEGQDMDNRYTVDIVSLIHISEPTGLRGISYAVLHLKKDNAHETDDSGVPGGREKAEYE